MFMIRIRQKSSVVIKLFHSHSDTVSESALPETRLIKASHIQLD
jgi:hypothetical protein